MMEIHNRSLYDKLFANGPLKADEGIDTEDFDMYQYMCQETKGLIEPQTLCYAIWADKMQELQAAYDAAFEANSLEYNHDTEYRTDVNGMRYEQQIKVVNNKKILPTIQRQTNYTDGTVPWTVVAWSPDKEDGFFTKKIMVRYGNCPNCYRCLPVGWSCDNIDCSELEVESESTRNYFVTEPPLPRVEPPRSQVANPLILAQMVNAIAQVSLDELMFRKMPTEVEEHEERPQTIYYGYRPTASDLWSIQWLDSWMDRVDFKQYAYLERELHKVTKFPMSTIQESMNYYKEDKEHLYPQHTWDAITRARTFPQAVFGEAIRFNNHE